MAKKWLSKWLKWQEGLRKEGHKQCGVMVVITDGDDVLMKWDDKNNCYTMPMYPTYDGC